MKKSLLPVALIALLAAVGCKKDSPTPVTPTSDSTLIRDKLILGSWKWSFEAEDVNGNKILDASERQLFSDSVAGIFYQFDTGGTGLWSVPSENVSQPFSWGLYESGQRLFIATGNSKNTMNIPVLTSSELILEYLSPSDNRYYWRGLKR